MIESHTKYIIIGAGLSGLTTAYQLLKKGEENFLILEGRNRIGGRIHTKDGIDLGATWFQDHHTSLSRLIGELGLKRFDQYNTGKSILVYNSMAPAHFFESDANAPSAQRIVNGSIAIINQLAKPLKDKIKLSTTVTSVLENSQLLTIQTGGGNYTCQKAVITLPPQLASGLNFIPALPADLRDVMLSTHTWMSNAIKVGITYKRPFWRDQELSGTIIGQIGAMIELYDHSDHSGTSFSLMGFANEGLRDELPENRKERILSYLEKYLGTEVRDYINYHEKDWSIDPYTSGEKLKSVYMSPQYGNPMFQGLYMNEKLLFSGAETSSVYGGYMDGAICSGLNAASKLLEDGKN